MSGVDTALLQGVAARIERSLGLKAAPGRLQDLAAALAAAAPALGCRHADDCARGLLLQPPEALPVALLASHLCNGETHFRRDAPTFAALEREIVPELLQRCRAAGRPLRVWSAGCSSGEEPWSLALLLARWFGPSLGEQARVLGSDINPEALARARAAIYGEWSFRGCDAAFRHNYFSPHGKRWRLRPAWRGSVHFVALNLARPFGRADLPECAAQDLILCRNVLMYFSPEQAARTLADLANCLGDGGVLLLTASEVPLVRLPGLETVTMAGVIVHRRIAAGAADAAVAAAAPPPVAPMTSMATAPIATVMPPPAEPAPSLPHAAAADAASAPASSHATALLASARAAADRGQLDASWALCEQALALQPLAVEAHLLGATILWARGELDAAGAAFDRVLYLDPTQLPALLGLAQVALRQGHEALARQRLAQLALLLAAQPGDPSIAGADGLNADRLADFLGQLSRRQAGAPAARSGPP